MACLHCGREVRPGQNYCSGCGRPVETSVRARASAGTNRAAGSGHIHVLGLLWVSYGALWLLPSALLLVIGRVGIPHLPAEFRQWFRPLIESMGVLLLALGTLGIIVGCSLLENASWARTAALTAGAIVLTHPLLGTLLGLYTLWLLLPADRGAPAYAAEPFGTATERRARSGV